MSHSVSRRDRLADRILELFQVRCPHNPAYVAADILDGDFFDGPGGGQGVEWCMRCGAYRRISDPWGNNGKPRPGDLHVPHATWTQWHRGYGREPE